MPACFSALFTGYSKEDPGDKITVPTESRLAQTAYADEDDTPESKSKYRQTIRYDKTLSAGKANMNLDNIIGDIYMGDINTEAGEVFGKTGPNPISEYLSYYFDENKQEYRLSEKSFTNTEPATTVISPP